MFEIFLAAEEVDLTPVHRLPRRRYVPFEGDTRGIADVGMGPDLLRLAAATEGARRLRRLDVFNRKQPAPVA
jgi:hypothetical protein